MDQAPELPRALDARSAVASALTAAGCKWAHVPFTREGWDGALPGNGVTTPFGDVEVLPEQLDTPEVGVSLIGLIQPVLSDPTFVLRSGDVVSFHRAVLGPAGEPRGYATVEFVGPRIRLYVSEKPAIEWLLDGVVPPGVTGTIDAELDADGDALFKSCLWMVNGDADLVNGASPMVNGASSIGAYSPYGASLGAKFTIDVTKSVQVIIRDFTIAMVLAGASPDLIKSDHGAIPADARWITVHPNGAASKGQPILVVPAGKDGSMRVIGGAGGKLNMLKLKGVKSEAHYKQEAAERSATARQKRKDQIASDKGLGIHEAKQKARAEVDVQRRKAQDSFIAQVAESLGWEPSALQVETEGFSPEAAKKAEAQHRAQLLARAKEAVGLQRRALVADAERRSAAGLGLVSFNAGPDELGVEDLDPGRIPDSSGISVSFAKMAEAAGLTDDAVEAEKAKLAAAAGKPVDPEAKIEKAKVAAALKAQMDTLEKPDLFASIVEAKKAVGLLKSLKALQALEKQARAAKADIDATVVEPQAYVLAVSDPTDAEVEQIVKDDLGTASAAAFLSGVKDVADEDDLGSHIHAGAYASLNALSQSVGGASLVDRAVVDVLGVAATAQVLSARLHAEYGAGAAEIAAGLAQFHVEHAGEQQKAALEEAKELQDLASSLELDLAAHPSELPAAVAINQQRLDALGEVRAVLGRTLGEQEARASMIAALESAPRSSIDVSLGKASTESAMQQLWAIGLTGGDFEIEKAGDSLFAKINSAGIDKLAGSVDHDNIARVQRNLAIMKGAEDEDDWLPAGFAKRADMGLDLKPGVADRMAVQFDAGAADLSAALKDYIGSRVADGDRAADILSDVQSATFFQKVGQDRAKEYGAALDAAVPTKKDGKLIRVEDLAPVFEQYADDFVGANFGGTRSTLNRQKFEPDDISQEALHRALSDEPAGTLAYRPIGELSLSERGQLRDWFFKHVAHESPEQTELRQNAEKLAAAEPDKHAMDMFGDMSANPAWTDWKVEYDAAQQKANDAGLDWQRYAKVMGGPEGALQTVQDLIRSRVSDRFAEAHNTLRPHAPLAIGKTVVRNNLRHLSAVDPVEREKRLNMERALIDQLRNRVKGKYAGGSVSEKIEQHKSYEAAFGQAQMGFFSADEMGADEATPLGQDERRTIGHAAESMIGKMMGVVGRNFEPGKPVKLFRPSMSGPEGVKRQRAIKLIRENKRVILGAGVGSGKTAMMLGGFADAHEAGDVKKGIFVVPSIVQGQFGAEALRFLEPGKFNWHAKPGAPYAERLAAYKDPSNHFTVVTHQSFRDDLLRMAVDAGKADTPEAAAALMDSMSRSDRKAWMKGVLDHHGIEAGFAAVDEGHNLLDREGKDDSRMSTAIGAFTDNASHYVHASGDPVKNDASEAFSLLEKMDPARYSDRAAFMRRYGGDAVAAKEGLQREMARHLYTFALSPDVSVSKSERKVSVTDAQQAALDTLDKQVAALRIANMSGGVDVEAAKALSPHLFEGMAVEDHAELAKRVARSAGIIKQSAVRRILDNHPSSGKLSDLAQVAGDRKGKPGVVFAHSLDAVEAIRKRLEADGHRVITITGKDSSADKDGKLRQFNPDKGEAGADIVVASDAGATGANMQSGRWLYQFDTPQTAMTHAQRNGRINRIGQKNDLELFDAIVDHPDEYRARKRLATKYGLRDMLTSPLDGIDDSGMAYYLKQAGFGASEVQKSLF